MPELNKTTDAAAGLAKRRRISISGRVQGVGCRPFIYRAASQLGLTGLVYNDSRGVSIEVQGPSDKIDEFQSLLQSSADRPPLMEIATCRTADLPLDEALREFVISASEQGGAPVSQVTPDTATCSDCLGEMGAKEGFRHRYPFINCTNCGPRYSIIKTIPYDRPNTTMTAFKMCPACQSQYDAPADRRFHAQPVACPACGPEICLVDASGGIIEKDSDAAVRATAEMLTAGKIVAIKGIGGFHLAADALDDDAARRLRSRKHRDHKPFAIMAASVESIRRFAEVDETAEKLLTSPQGPIVLLPKAAGNPIAASVAEGTGTFGFMLCYAPLHHLLFAEENIEALVMTSGNISDEPLICGNDEALAKLSEVADAFLMHDRDIYRQIDDSIVQIVGGAPAALRRARGYVPTPILAGRTASRQIFAAGADLKNTFCFGKGDQFILSEHIGDLENALVYRHYINSVEHLRKLFEVDYDVVACDLHPGYLSTQYAQTLKAERIIPIQHHWAHIASALAEYDYRERVIGLVADGSGWGVDGAVWGCECLIASLSEFERFGHLSYYPIAGGDSAAKEPIRPILGLLKSLCGDSSYLDRFGGILRSIEPDAERLRVISEQLERDVNTHQTSSLGRLFDAVAALLGLGTYNHFEAELPMALEAVADPGISESYNISMIDSPDGTVQLDVRSIIESVVMDVQSGADPATISAKFHQCLADGLLQFAVRAREKFDLETVVLSGGVFCNRNLANCLITMLKNRGFCVLFKKRVPVNDGSIALGQAAIAAELTGYDN